MEKRVGNYALTSITEEEAKRLMDDPKNKELEMLWNMLHGDDGEPLSEGHQALWFEIAEKLDF